MLKTFLIPKPTAPINNNYGFFIPLENEFVDYFDIPENHVIGEIAIVPSFVVSSNSWCEYTDNTNVIWTPVTLGSNSDYEYDGVVYAKVEYDPSMFNNTEEFSVLFTGYMTANINNVGIHKWSRQYNIDELSIGKPINTLDLEDAVNENTIFPDAVEFDISGPAVEGMFHNAAADASHYNGEKLFVLSELTIDGATYKSYARAKYTYIDDELNISVRIKYPDATTLPSAQDLHNLVDNLDDTVKEYIVNSTFVCADDIGHTEFATNGIPGTLSLGFETEDEEEISEFDVQNQPVVLAQKDQYSIVPLFTEDLIS